MRNATKLRRFATSGDVTFSGVSRRYENDARWRIFNVRAWARSFERFEPLIIPGLLWRVPGVPGVIGTSQSKAQAIGSGPGLRRSYQSQLSG